MKIKLGSIFLFCLLILIFINYNFISTYNLFTFYILLMLLPSILYSNCCVFLLRHFKKGRAVYYLLSTIVHFLLNWVIIHRLLTKEVFNSLVENTVKINPSVGNNSDNFYNYLTHTAHGGGNIHEYNTTSVSFK